MRLFLKRSLVLLTCLFLLNGCATKLAYNFLDWATLWYIERYVNLDSQQKDYAKNYLKKFHQWHRSTQLTQYADYLEGLKDRLTTGKLTGRQIHDETDDLQIYLDRCIDYLTPLFIELAATLNDEQVLELMENLAKDRKDYQKDYIDISTEKLHKTRIEDLTDNLRLGGIGGYSRTQKKLMQQWTESLIPFEALTLKQQEIWANELKAALDNRGNREQLEKTLRRLLFVHTDNWDAELEKRMDTNQEITYDALATLMNSLSPKQQNKMLKKLDGYIKDFRELAAASEQ